MAGDAKGRARARPAFYLLWGALACLGQTQESGREIYQAACAACHGHDARGADRSTVGFETPLPDFTDCNFATREAAADWRAVVRGGGPARGFSRIMPAFGEALSRREIEEVVNYLRGFCAEPAWPRGEFNLPRPLVTSKAIPEDETVLTTTINAEGAAAVTNRIVYERRLKARNQVEVALPFRFAQPPGSHWVGGVGDLALGFKRTLFHSLPKGAIVSLSGEALLPTGEKARGFGKGVTVLETFLTYGQLLASKSFFQFQGGLEAPTHSDDAAKAVFWRGVLGKSFSQGGDGRLWSPMVELLADRELESGAKVLWDVVPQFQVTLSRRQHIRANVGLRIPVNQTAGRLVQIMFYLLWDRFDGGLTQGW
jgi:mono/diheme cytochrome c family protein